MSDSVGVLQDHLPPSLNDPAVDSAQVLIQEARSRGKRRKLIVSVFVFAIIIAVAVILIAKGAYSHPAGKQSHSIDQSRNAGTSKETCNSLKIWNQTDLQFAYPSCWNVEPGIESTGPGDTLARITTQPGISYCVHPTKSLTQCGVRDLDPGKFYMSWSSVEFYFVNTINKTHDAQRIKIDGRTAYEKITFHPSSEIDATEVLSVWISTSAKKRWYSVSASIRGPRILKQQKEIQQLLSTAKLSGT